jgi:hypothetical protein
MLMDAADRAPATAVEDDVSWGLAGVGRAGLLSVELDEAVSGRERWQISLDSPSWHVRFEAASPQALARMHGFLEQHGGQRCFAEDVVASIGGGRVLIVKDDELPDRFFLKLFGEQQFVMLTLHAEEVRDLTEALKQAMNDWTEPEAMR